MGACAILGRKDGRESWLSILFGTGLGLTLDEIALLIKLDNPYWGSQRLVLIEGSVAALGAGLLALRFSWHGRLPETGEPGIGPEFDDRTLSNDMRSDTHGIN
jgi:hypothetical protein